MNPVYAGRIGAAGARLCRKRRALWDYRAQWAVLAKWNAEGLKQSEPRN